MGAPGGTPLRFDGCSGVPDRLFGVGFRDICLQHDGCDMAHLRATGEERPRRGASYVNGGPLIFKLRDDAAFAGRLLWRGLTAPRPRACWLALPAWPVIALAAFLGVSIFGGPWCPRRLALALNAGRDFRWGHVRPRPA